MSSHFQQRHARRVARVFSQFDVDRSGTIECAELVPALAELGVTGVDEAEAARLLAGVDGDRSGALDLAEFASLFEEGRLHQAFAALDADADGSVRAPELCAAFRDLGYELSTAQVIALLRRADADADGAISYEEFRNFFEWMPLASLESIAARWASLDGCDVGTDISPPIAKKQPGLPPWAALVCGGVGGIISRTLTAPLETVKLAAQCGRRIAPDVAGSLRAVAQRSGPAALWAGNLANCTRVFPYAGIVTATYVSLLPFTPADATFDAMEPVWRGGCAAVAGCIGQICTYPLDVVRARIALQRSEAGADSTRATISGTLRELVAERALYRGLLPTLVAVSPFLAVQLAVVDAAKSAVAYRDMELSAPILLATGATAGAAAQSAVFPLDVVRRTMQARRGTAQGGMLATARDIVAKAGIRGLFAGIVPTYMKVIPSCALGVTFTNELVMSFKARAKRLELEAD